MVTFFGPLSQGECTPEWQLQMANAAHGIQLLSPLDRWPVLQYDLVFWMGQLGCLWSTTDTWSQKLWADSARWQFRFFQAKYSQHSPSKDASFSSSAVSAPDSDDTFGYFREFTSRTLWFLLQGCRGDGDAREAGHWWLVGFDGKWLAEWLAKTIDFSLTSHWLLIDFSLTSHWLHAQIQMTTWVTRCQQCWDLDFGCSKVCQKSGSPQVCLLATAHRCDLGMPEFHQSSCVFSAPPFYRSSGDNHARSSNVQSPFAQFIERFTQMWNLRDKFLAHSRCRHQAPVAPLDCTWEILDEHSEICVWNVSEMQWRQTLLLGLCSGLRWMDV